MRGTNLATLRQMLKAEVGNTLTAGVNSADDARFNQLLYNKQLELASQYTWPFLRTRKDVPLVSGQRFYPLPSICFERPHTCQNQWNLIWTPMDYGIDENDYNVLNSLLVPPMQVDPVRKWMIVDAQDVDLTGVALPELTADSTEITADSTVVTADEDSTVVRNYFEVWPVPITAQVIRFTGESLLDPLVEDTDTADLDDLLLVFGVASEEATNRELGNARLLQAKFQNRLKQCLVSMPTRPSVFIPGSGTDRNVMFKRQKRVLLG